MKQLKHLSLPLWNVMWKRGSAIKITEKYILYYILYNAYFAFGKNWYSLKQYLLEGIFMVNFFKKIYCLNLTKFVLPECF